ncbi:MAG: cytochrome c3 family protein, partial [Planctomycetota bacterium]
MAAKVNASADDIDIAVFEWSKSCSPCHPGGGPLEFDRDGNRYDEHAPNVSADTLDGDYFGNDWVNSGVLEADCLLCHMESYRTAARTPVVKEGRHRVAPAVGAIMGTADDNAVVSYDTAFALKIRRRADRNCSQCHAGVPDELFNAAGVLKSDIAKRGRSWDDPMNPDVHDAKLDCISCHHAGTVAGQAKDDHQFQKGHIKVGSSVRDDLDNALGFQSCESCHVAGTEGAPQIAADAASDSIDAHEQHRDVIHCTTCHIPRKGLFAVRSFDFLEGAKVPFFLGGSPKDPYASGVDPAYLWWHEETAEPYTWKIYPFNFLTAAFWNKGSEERYAYFLKQIKPVWQQLVDGGVLTDDIGDAKGGLAEPNTKAEIDAFVAALAAAG